MKIVNTRINGIENPRGFCCDSLSCSWQVAEAQAKKQAYARIEVSLSPDFEEILYTKEGPALDSIGETLEIVRKPRTTYYYRVSVTGDNGESAVSGTSFFETGKMDEPWEAEWIGMAEGETMHPVFSREFALAGKVKRARLYATAAGVFEAYLNGRKLGKEYLIPYLTDYARSIQVITFPVEELLQEKNVLEIKTGKGWYMSVFGLDLKAENFGNRMAAIAELHLEYEDGAHEVIATDERWTCCGSLVEDSGIYLGEIYNRLLWEDKDNKERPVQVLCGGPDMPGIENLRKDNLSDRLSLPVLAKETVTVKEVIHTPAGETVLDMGQNFAGILEFEAKLPKGTRVVLDFGEILQQGNFYNGNYRDAQSRFVYVSDGSRERVRPHFTFFGFRYVRLSGWVGELDPADFRGLVLYSDITRTGFVETGHEKVNRLYENTVWGLKSNFLDIPTDCPQRSERLGWTGDAQVFSPTACYHMDTRAFYHKFLHDLKVEQACLGGAVPNFLPNFGHPEAVSSVWGDVAAILPETLYRYYGNKEDAKFNYDLIKEWVDYLTRKDQERGQRYLFDFDFGFGDWLALDGATPTSFSGGTDIGYIGSMYYYNSTRILAGQAKALGYEEDGEIYEALAEKIREAILREYFSGTGRLAVNNQAAYVIALKFGVFRDRQKLLKEFAARLELDCNQIKCGFVGAPLLCTVLAENGMTELAYDFLLKEGFPSWLYSVNLGATTIWERWNSVLPDGTISDTGMNSLNHYSYGSVMEFMYAHIAGIRPLSPGFREAVIAPAPDVRLGYVNCRYDSVSGTYVSNWSIEADGSVRIHVEIPFGCSARVYLPGYSGGENAAALEGKEAFSGNRYVVDGDGGMLLSAGSYDFTYMPQKSFRKPYHEGTTLARLALDPSALAILEAYTPGLAGIARSQDPEIGAKSLKELLGMRWLPFEPDRLALAIREIEQLTV